MEVFDLSMDDILDASELELNSKKQEPQDVGNKETNNNDDGGSVETGKETEEKELFENNAAEVLDAKNLELESVGGEDSEKDKGSTVNQTEGSSPTYSSIASAFKVDGVPLFSDEDDERISKIESASDFEDFIKEKLEAVIDNRLGETEKRIKDALTYGMEPSDIQVFENSLQNLNSIKVEDIEDESEKGENLRKNLIYTDLINKGYSEDRAKKKVQQIIDAGLEVDEAKDALESNKSFYQAEYDKAFNARKEEHEKFVKQREKDAESLRKSILDDEKAFGDVSVSKAVRQKIYDAINRPIGKDGNGNPVSALQKYADENPVEFRKNLAYFFVMTDGFKSLDKIKDSVSKEVRKKEISALERTLNTTARDSNGAMKLVGGNDGSFGSGEQPWQIVL